MKPSTFAISMAASSSGTAIQRRCYGWTKQDAEGDRLDLLQTQFPAPLKEIDAAIFHDGRWESELTQAAEAAANGRPLRWVPLRNDAGDLKRSSSSTMTSRRRRIQKKLLEERDPTADPGRSSPVVLFAIDPDGILDTFGREQDFRRRSRVEELVEASIFDLYPENSDIVNATQRLRQKEPLQISDRRSRSTPRRSRPPGSRR